MASVIIPCIVAGIELDEQAHEKYVLDRAYESNYDIGMGLLEYPSPKPFSEKLKEWFNRTFPDSALQKNQKVNT